MEELYIRVRYPHHVGNIVLLTSLDWEMEIQPIEVDEGDSTTVFHVAADRSFLYFKPVLKIGDERHFCQGANYLALTQADEYEVYPHFFSESVGAVTDLETFECSSDPERSHSVRVYLPPGYSENTLRRYPVLYMHDGHNLFFPDEAFSGQTWEVGSTLMRLDSMNIIDPVIVVAIYPQDRMREYVHPGYEAYGRYIVEDVKRRIDATYRTLKHPRFTGLMGSSLGGVVSLYMGLQWPEVFGKVACLSSTFTWRDNLMQRVIDEEKKPLQIYLDSGWPGDNFEVTRTMFDLLQRQGYEVNREVMYLAYPDARHSESDWATRLHIPFQFLFARYAEDDMVRLRQGRQPERDPASVAL